MSAIRQSLKQLAEAIADLSGVVELRRDEHATRYHLAVMQLYVGDEQAYRQTCAELLRRFKDTQDPGIATRTARVCALAPGVADDAEAATRLADQPLARDNSPTFLLTKGLVEYRAGKFEAAAKALGGASDGYAQLLSQPDKVGQNWQLVGCSRATTSLLLAMAQFRCGRTADAEKTMFLARQHLAAIAPGIRGATAGGVGGVDWLIAHIAAREAEDLLGKQFPATAPATTHPAAPSR